MPRLVEADAENWGSGLSKQSCQSYYMLFSHDIQVVKQDKKVTSALFIDVKGAFDNGISIETDIQIGIPQNSSISPILFLIYIRNLFQDLESRGINYIDDINLVASSESIEKNYKILKEAVIKIFEKGANNLI